MNKICYGCGIKLQSSDIDMEGFTPKEDAVYCMRCYKLMHYGNCKHTNTPKDVKQIVSSVSKDNKFVCFLVDFLSINLEVIKIFKSITGKKMLLISKCDLIPKDVKYNSISDYLRDYYNIKEDIKFINTTDSKIKSLLGYFKMHNINVVYFLGLSNSGKSTLINNIIDYTGSKMYKTTTSYSPNTTIDFIRLKINNDLTIIDSPGFIIPCLFINNKETFKYAIKPRVFQMRDGESICFNKEYKIKFANSSSITFYVPNNINIYKDFKQQIFEYELIIPENTDLVIMGLGFINIKSETKLYINNIDKSLIDIRPSIFRGKICR